MLKSIKLENFRGFDNHELPFKETTVIVGRNNAGKSTVVEALRLVAIVVGRYENLSYREPPSWTDLPKVFYGVSPSLRNYEINFSGIFHRYAEPPAIITASFVDNSSITIYLFGQDKIHATIRDSKENIVRAKNQASRVNLSTVDIMPQVAPVQQNEVILSDDYVKSAISSSLAPLHFRNQLRIWYDLFPEFQKIVEKTWPSVKVMELIGRNKLPHEPLYLQVRNEDFVAEIASMGHGLQMWLQTMWFLTLSRDSTTVILDEPDVYMHADLQRRLIRFLKKRHPQTIITTHSVEIMAEVQPDEILVVDKRRSRSTFASSLPAVQKIIENVGSVHNLHLAKLLDARRFILVEGKDLKILKQFQNMLFPDAKEPFDSIPHMSIGGWGGWSYAVGSSMFLQNSMGEKIITYCILDSDYHTLEEKEERHNEARSRGVHLHIWSQKEIENYLVVSTVIHRLICRRLSARIAPPTPKEIDAQVLKLALEMEEDIFDAISAEILARQRSLGQGGANKLARKVIKDEIDRAGNFLSLVSGKEILSRLSQWCQAEFRVSFNAIAIAREMNADDIAEEMRKIVAAIENGETLD